ncbi:MAG: hypothetical protein ACFFB3_20460 [Candidatus Hodarchaeota archaeon]
MPSKTFLRLPSSKELHDEYENSYKDYFQFKSAEYQDPSLLPQRPDRWYNGSLMGAGGRDTTLFGSNGRLRSLHTKITSQETPGSQPRGQYYRLVGDILSQFFSFSILDPLIDELISIENFRLPRAMDEAVSVVLAAVEMHLRKHNRMILKEVVIAEIAEELGIDISRSKITAAKWFLAKGGFWKEHLYDINTATYDILRNLTLELIANYQFPAQDDMIGFRRQLYHRCQTVIESIEKSARRPQVLEVYAHAIASIAAEEILGISVDTAKQVGNSSFSISVYRAKRQILDILSTSSKKSQPELRVIPKISHSQFSKAIRRAISQDLPPEAIQNAWGELLRFETVYDTLRSQKTENFPLANSVQQKPYSMAQFAEILEISRLGNIKQLPSVRNPISGGLSILEEMGAGSPPWSSGQQLPSEF